MQSLILLVVGEDRPGLVRRLAEWVKNAGGNWLESRFAHLAGHFAGVVRIELPAAQREALTQSMRALQDEGLTVVVTPTTPPAQPAGGETMWLEVVGHDRPGIVHQVAAVLARHGVNIEELESGTELAPQTNDRLFRARARVTVPSPVAAGAVRRDLEAIAQELMVDWRWEREDRGHVG